MRKLNVTIAAVCGLGWAVGLATAFLLPPLSAWSCVCLVLAGVNGLLAGDAAADALLGK